MDLGIRGRVALIAASSKGIGKAVAKGLAAEGVRIAICSREADTLQETAQEIRQETASEVFSLPTDLTDPVQTKALVGKTRSALGPIDILVNNAGGPPTGTFASLTEDDFRAAIELNLMSGIILTREVLPGMTERGWGRIINLTSISVKQPVDNLILSNTARAGVVGWAKTLSNEVASHSITVNNVCPGYTRTHRIEDLAAQLARQQGVPVEEVMKNWQSVIPMRRLATPEEIADAVLFLASERASYVTGVSLQVDGGFVRGIY